MAEHVHNFNAGPAALPPEVLDTVQRELKDLRGSGISILSHSHRAATFEGVLEEAKQRIAALYALPASHEVVFLQGGGSLQFAQVPMNFGLGGSYLDTGRWSSRAFEEAQTWAQGQALQPQRLWSSEAQNYQHVPQRPTDYAACAPDSPYLHYTSNNTIYGTQYQRLPERRPHDPPLICDASSDFLSRPMAIEQHALIYAGAQKNAGPSGLAVLLIDRQYSRAFHGDPRVPTILRYSTQAKADSMYNTPNTFAIYVLGLTAAWAQAQGGLEALHQQAKAKAGALYDLIDAWPQVFEGHAQRDSRSLMNISFRLREPQSEAALFEQLDRAQIVGVRGHRSVGGLRASLYNAVSQASVDRLVQLLEDFARRQA